jgi:peroxiredoxin
MRFFTHLHKALLAAALGFVSVIALCGACSAEALVGSQAPDFSLKDSAGNDVTLSQFKGKIVVLEWFNANCPFVKKFYRNGDMQRFQSEATAKGAAWLTISSSAPGKSGYIPSDTAESVRSEHNMKSTALLLDSDGVAGKAYGARTTPHLFVVDAQGKVAYAGAIDNEASTDSDDIKGATNYALSSIDALAAGKPVEPATTEPYGCGVKY